MSAQLDLYDVVYGSKCVVAIQEYEEIIARIAELETKTQWQPIESAPKDGTEIRLWEHPYEYTGHWTIILGQSGWLAEGYIINPTHWMPLPKPPEEKVKVTLTTGEVFVLNKSEVVKYQQEHKNAIFAKLEPPEEGEK